jgi:hypothetical protein
MTIRVLALCGILSGLTAVASPQDPSLTGNWARNTNGSSASCQIEQQGVEVAFHIKTHVNAGSLSAGTIGAETYTADGVEREKTSDSGHQSWLTAYWQGQTLVIVHVTKSSYRVVVTRETWTVSEDGLTLAKHTQRIDMDGVTETTEEFQRQ